MKFSEIVQKGVEEEILLRKMENLTLNWYVNTIV